MSFLPPNASIDVTIPANQSVIIGSYGGGTASIEYATDAARIPRTFYPQAKLTDAQATYGPFPAGRVVRITSGLCELEYSVGAVPFLTRANKFSQDASGNVTGLVGPDGSRITYGAKNGIVILGDSRTDQNNNPSRANKNAQGVLVWAQALSRRAGFYITQNLGVSSDRTDQMLARLPTAVADTAAVAMLWGGVNDIAQSYPAAGTSGATAFANIATMVAALVQSGKQVVVVLETPVNSWTSAQRTQLFALNNLLTSAYSGAKNVHIADFFSVVTDPASATVQARSGYYSDQTHVNIRGAYFCGKVLRDIVDPLLSGSLLALPSSVADSYTLNPLNTLKNGLFLTTTGGTTGANITGDTPASWVTGRVSGTGTGVVSSAASPDGIGNDIILTHTAAAGDVFRITQDMTPAEVVVGASYVFEGEIQVTSATGLRDVKAFLEYNGSIAGTTQRFVFEDTVAGAGPDEDFTVRFQSVPLTVPDGTINWFLVQVRPTFNAASSAVVKLRRARVRRIS